MTEATREALAGAEPVDPDHYFAGVSFEPTPGSPGSGPRYGLIEASFPDETAPVNETDTRIVQVVRVEDLDDDYHYPRPALTLLFEHDDPDDEGEEAHVELLLDGPRPHSDIPNQLVENPGDARAIITKAMQKHGLRRATTNEEAVAGIPSERFQNAAGYLIKAGFEEIDKPDSEASDTFEISLAA